ncbi:hypothetical protein DFH11DRAFT_361638 [Phellopilus nigrolimitatus]|nr:hypothetical protein DFH11DRAFT_361638 [Phellopilus nigrolimitatus]
MLRLARGILDCAPFLAEFTHTRGGVLLVLRPKGNGKRETHSTMTDEDHQLAKLLFNNPNARPNLQEFAAGLIRDCLTSELPIAT